MTWWQWLLVGVAAYFVIMAGLAVALVVGRRRQEKEDAQLREWIEEYDDRFRRGSRSSAV